LNEVKQKLKAEEGFTDDQLFQMDKNMIYHKSVVTVRKNSAEMSERMRPQNIDHVESKIKVHFKNRQTDDTPESLKAKNLRYLDKKGSKSSAR